MKYRVSVNGKRKAREKVSRERYIERLLEPIEIVEETVTQPEGQPEFDSQAIQQQLVQSFIRIQARSRKRSRTRAAFRMLPPKQQVLAYTPVTREISLPEQLLNRMSLPTIRAVLPAMKIPKSSEAPETSTGVPKSSMKVLQPSMKIPKQSMKPQKQSLVQVHSSDRALKLIRLRAVITRSYSRFRMMEPTTAGLKARSSYRDVCIKFSVKIRRFNSPIRVPPIEQERKGVGCYP